LYRGPSLLKSEPVRAYDGEGQEARLGSTLNESGQRYARVELGEPPHENLKPETGGHREGQDPATLRRCRWRRCTALHIRIRAFLDKATLEDWLDLLERIAAQGMKKARQNGERSPTASFHSPFTSSAPQAPHIDGDNENAPCAPDAPHAYAVANQCPEFPALGTLRRHIHRWVPPMLRITIDIEPEVMYDYT
jgi:hypothetical protein